MRVLAYEFITGGGLAGATIPEGLQREGEAMLSSLVSDLSELEDVEVLVARDSRLAAPAWRAQALFASPGEGAWAHFKRAMLEADAVWPIAPESDGALEMLTSLIVSSGKVLLGSRPDAVRIAASKRRTAEHLLHSGLRIVPTYQDAAQIPNERGSWVVKPDDGAGCCDTFRLTDAAAARTWLHGDVHNRFVAQPWVEGEAMSLSVLCRQGHARVLSCNRQYLHRALGRLVLRNVSVAVCSIDAAIEEIARCTARALPGLWGYVGIDFVCSTTGPVVMEINPRLTSSYCALRSRLGINVAGEVLHLLDRSVPLSEHSNQRSACMRTSSHSPGSTRHVA